MLTREELLKPGTIQRSDGYIYANTECGQYHYRMFICGDRVDPSVLFSKHTRLGEQTFNYDDCILMARMFARCAAALREAGHGPAD